LFGLPQPFSRRPQPLSPFVAVLIRKPQARSLPFAVQRATTRQPIPKQKEQTHHAREKSASPCRWKIQYDQTFCG
ncbi:MAG TPA: hypothetical protein PLQ88_00450, partial [Blastocatellia bacterium]|nr:hypothetical protein [Blastocatellia bacterium]